MRGSKTHPLSLGCLAQHGYWIDLRADIGTLFFLDKIQTQHNQTQLHKEERLLFVKGMLMASLVAAGVSDDVAQESQVPIGPHMLDDLGEPMPARPATLKDPGALDQLVLDQHSLASRVSHGARCASNLEDAIHHIENSRKSAQWCLNFSLTTATWEMEALCRLLVSSWKQTLLLEPYRRRWCQIPRRWTCPTWLPEQPSGCVT